MKLVEWETLGSWSGNDYRSLISNLGGEENALAVKSGQLVFKVAKPATETDSGEFVLEQPVKPWLDHTGRRIPAPGMKAADENRSFNVVQSKLDYAERVARFESGFQCKQGITAAEFEDRIGLVMLRLAKDERLASLILQRVYLPILIPQTETSLDYGTLLETIFLPAVEREYKWQFSGRIFKNYRAGELTGRVKVVEKSHQILLDAIYRGPMVALYFPNALQGFSIPADREQMKDLPKDLLLCGVIDTATALVGYPDVLARDYQTPGLDCAAVQWQSGRHSLYFRAYDDQLKFDYRYLDAYGSYSGGFGVLG